MKTILQQWNLMRILRLGLGIAIIVQGIAARETVAVVLGVIFGGMAFANIGCCGTNGCAINSRSTDKNKKIDYEELDSKK
jgi:hypothetical protein